MHVAETVARANVFTQTTSYSANLLWLISSDLLLTRPSALLGAPSAKGPLPWPGERFYNLVQAKDLLSDARCLMISSRRKILQSRPGERFTLRRSPRKVSDESSSSRPGERFYTQDMHKTQSNYHKQQERQSSRCQELQELSDAGCLMISSRRKILHTRHAQDTDKLSQTTNHKHKSVRSKMQRTGVSSRRQIYSQTQQHIWGVEVTAWSTNKQHSL